MRCQQASGGRLLDICQHKLYTLPLQGVPHCCECLCCGCIQPLHAPAFPCISIVSDTHRPLAPVMHKYDSERKQVRQLKICNHKAGGMSCSLRQSTATPAVALCLSFLPIQRLSASRYQIWSRWNRRHISTPSASQEGVFYEIQNNKKIPRKGERTAAWKVKAECARAKTAYLRSSKMKQGASERVAWTLGLSISFSKRAEADLAMRRDWHKPCCFSASSSCLLNISFATCIPPPF